MTVPRLAVIGSGQMAEALIGGFLESGLVASDAVWATDVSVERREAVGRRFGVRTGADNREAAAWARVVVLAVKPQVLPEVLAGLGPALATKLVISIAAGVSLQQVAQWVPRDARLVRVMPNAPALLREGISALAFGPGVSEEEASLARALFEAVGRVVVLDERLMHAVTGLSGSGPAYACVVLEAMADGGVKAGLPRGVASTLATQTMLGAARLWLEPKEHDVPTEEVARRAGEPALAGLHALERGALRATLVAAVEAATRKSEELGR